MLSLHTCFLEAVSWFLLQARLRALGPRWESIRTEVLTRGHSEEPPAPGFPSILCTLSVLGAAAE